MHGEGKRVAPSHGCPNRLLALPYKLGLALRAPGLLAAYTLAKQRFL